jgi:hypothetical protein
MPQPTPYDTDAILWWKIAQNSGLSPDGGLPWQEYVRQMIVAYGGEGQGPDGAIVKEWAKLFLAAEGSPVVIQPYDTEDTALSKVAAAIGSPNVFDTSHGHLRAICAYTA